MKHILWFLILLVLIGCSGKANEVVQQASPETTQEQKTAPEVPSEVMVSQEAETAVTLSPETLELLRRRKIEIYSAPKNADGTHPYFYIHQYIGGDERFLVRGTYQGKPFGVVMSKYDERLAFTSQGVALCITEVKEDFPTWDCFETSLESLD